MRIGLLRIIGVLFLAAGLGACSTVRLAYDNLPSFGYWWLDKYVDFSGAQTPWVRDELDALLARHRREELPRLVALIEEARAEVPRDTDPARVCRLADAVRARLVAAAELIEPAAARLAVSLDAHQLAQIQARWNKTNADFADDWLDLTPAKLHDKRYRSYLDRYEEFYGPLDAVQRERLRALVTRSRFDPKLVDGERRQRQDSLMRVLQQASAGRSGPEEARALLHAWVLATAHPTEGPAQERERIMSEEGCAALAAMHNGMRAEQRARAQTRLEDYARDLRALIGNSARSGVPG